jgi:hypothetical protein
MKLRYTLSTTGEANHRVQFHLNRVTEASKRVRSNPFEHRYDH